jgi:hypothetical protein
MDFSVSDKDSKLMIYKNCIDDSNDIFLISILRQKKQLLMSKARLISYCLLRTELFITV